MKRFGHGAREALSGSMRLVGLIVSMACDAVGLGLAIACGVVLLAGSPTGPLKEQRSVAVIAKDGRERPGHAAEEFCRQRSEARRSGAGVHAGSCE